MPSPLVSVVIPVYNGAKFLGAAIESVLAQTYQPIELIIVDDGSTDDSPELIDSYGSRVVAVRQKNGGVGRARNAGILSARGDFVAFLDQDDWWMSDKVEKQVRVFLTNDRVGLVHTGVDHYDELTAAFVKPLDPSSRPEELVGNCYDRLLLGNHIYNSSVMVRKSTLDAVGGLDVEICGNTVQDYDLWLRFAQQTAFAYLPDKLLVIRLHREQGRWNRRQMLTQELRLLERLMSHPARPIPGNLAARVATVWHDLGVAHLDASERDEARGCFVRSIRIRWSSRVAMLCVASCLPRPAIDWLRRARAKLRRHAGGDHDANVPAWVKHVRR
jgi:glycosyltransferase involved in cell wall biosynthesis